MPSVSEVRYVLHPVPASSGVCDRNRYVVLAACAQRGVVPFSATASLSPAAILRQAHPPKCNGQKSTHKYASLTEKLSGNGGSVCIPEFAGFGGHVKYPSANANPPVKLKLISSTANYNHLPELGNGTAIFYLQIALSEAVSFGTKVGAGGGVTSKKIDPHQPYTVYGEVTISGFTFKFKPCYAVATKGKYGGVIGGIGTLLKGQDVPAAATGVIEIYDGKQTGKECLGS